MTVTANGITLRFGKQVFNYRNEQTGQLRGQKILAWFNPEAPEVLAVTDMNRENPFCVERSQSVPAMEASEDLMAQELARVEDHMGYARTRYRILKAQYDQEFRINVVSPQTLIGQQIEAQRGASRLGRTGGRGRSEYMGSEAQSRPRAGRGTNRSNGGAESAFPKGGQRMTTGHATGMAAALRKNVTARLGSLIRGSWPTW